MGSETKERILETSGELFRRQGYMGTGVKQIVEEAGAPFGSLYHFFPGGKEELGAETIRRSGFLYGLLFPEYVGPTSTSSTGSAPSSPAPRRLCGRPTTPTHARSPPSRSRSPAPARSCARPAPTSSTPGSKAGPPASRRPASRASARGELAIEILAALEGAFVLSRALRSTEPSTRPARPPPPRSPRPWAARTPRQGSGPPGTRTQNLELKRLLLSPVELAARGGPV